VRPIAPRTMAGTPFTKNGHKQALQPNDSDLR
jgi:hypothetical protein